MSKPDEFETQLKIKLKNKPSKALIDSIEGGLNNNDRVKINLKADGNYLLVKINARDITVIRSVLNTIFLSIKMIDEIDNYGQ